MGYLPEAVNAAPAVKKDYKVMDLDLGHGLSTKVMVCKKCGGLIILVRDHNDWHKKHGD